MKAIEIAYTIPRCVALAAGSVEYGEGTYTPTEAEIGAMSPEERDVLCRVVSFRLESCPTTWEAILAAVRIRVADDATQRALEAQRAIERAESDAAVARALDADVARILTIPPTSEEGVDIARERPYALSDARLSDWRAEARKARDAEDAAREAAAKAREAAAKAREAAEAEAREAAELRSKSGATAYALTIPEMERAAREGYGMVGVVAAHLCDLILAVVPACKPTRVLVEGTRAWRRTDWKARTTAPNAAAFAMLDAVVAHVATVALPDGWSLDTPEILRCMEKSDADDEGNVRVLTYTAVGVMLSAPGIQSRLVLIDTEIKSVVPST